LQDSQGGTATMTFDARNMQASEELGGSGITPIKELRTYTDTGRLDTVTRQKSSLGVWSNIGTTTHAYDAAGRLTAITHKDTTSAFASYAYAYDAADRLTSETINGSERTYTYDYTNQLTTDAGTPYSYDANGNRTMSGYATGTGNRMSNDGVWTYTYDAEGNVTKKSKGAASDTWTYGYDHRNQMTTAAFAATDGGTVTQRVTYVYDAIGNRIERDAWDGSAAVVERFGMDGWDPAKPAPVGFEQFDAWADLDGSNALVARRSYAPGFDVIVARESAGGSVGWYLTDHLGSVRGITNGDGTPLATISYDAWGTVTGNSTPSSSDRYGFTGRESDSLSGLWEHRQRVRGTGTWYSEDPFGLQADTNPQRFADNSPSMSTDPSGLLPPLKPGEYVTSSGTIKQGPVPPIPSRPLKPGEFATFSGTIKTELPDHGPTVLSPGEQYMRDIFLPWAVNKLEMLGIGKLIKTTKVVKTRTLFIDSCGSNAPSHSLSWRRGFSTKE
jgi:RHS repeat-associated protein